MIRIFGAVWRSPLALVVVAARAGAGGAAARRARSPTSIGCSRSSWPSATCRAPRGASIVDGQLAHIGVAGLRDVAVEGAGGRRQRLPHRVDDQELHRDVDPQAARRREAVARRSGGALRAGDGGDEVPDERRAEDHDPPSAVARRRISRGQPVGRSAARRHRRAAVADAARAAFRSRTRPGIAYEYSNLGFAILGRIVSNVSKMPYPDYVAANILRPLGMTSTTLEPSTVRGEPAGARLPLGGRAVEERAAAANGSFGSMGGMLTSVRDLSRYVGVFLSAWPPHDGPETAPIRRSSLREMQHLWSPAPSSVTRDRATGALQLTSGGYGYGLRVAQNCTFRTIVSHTGGLPGLRIGDDLAARLRRRHRRVRQPDLHRVGRHRDHRARDAGEEGRTCIRGSRCRRRR